MIENVQEVKIMRAFEFETSIEKGTVEIPVTYQKQLEKYQTVRVIILTKDVNDNQKDELEYLMDNPLKVNEVKPLTREEVYER
jgi:hypothetical protein